LYSRFYLPCLTVFGSFGLCLALAGLRIAFINKMDRAGADPRRVRRDMIEKLALNVVPIQLNMGAGEDFTCVIDLVTMEALSFTGAEGADVVRGEIPAQYAGPAQEARDEMLEAISMYNDELMELLIEDKPISRQMIHETIALATINRDIVPMMMGTAFKNKGVQPLMDAICDYLPSPLDRTAFARDHDNEGAEVPLNCDPRADPP